MHQDLFEYDGWIMIYVQIICFPIFKCANTEFPWIQQMSRDGSKMWATLWIVQRWTQRAMNIAGVCAHSKKTSANHLFLCHFKLFDKRKFCVFKKWS